MANLRQYEKCEIKNLREIVEMMSRRHAEMGGRDSRPERVALLKCIRVLNKTIDNLVFDRVKL